MSGEAWLLFTTGALFFKPYAANSKNQEVNNTIGKGGKKEKPR
jgi:hypothetical protein